MSSPRLPLTANFHFIKSCNFSCRYCYATFADLAGRPVLPDAQVLDLTPLLARTYAKVTLVGGEPTLYPRLPELLAAAASEGALTNIVTNGSRIDPAWLHRNADHLDLPTLSIDSPEAAAHRALGRLQKGHQPLTVEHYQGLAAAAHGLGIGVKVNTVVTTATLGDDMADLIESLAPQRWKVLQAAPVAGQNDTGIQALTPARADFDAYVARQETRLSGSGIRIVAEPIDTIRGSHIMVDPQGRFLDSTTGRHTYSSAILQVGLHDAFRDVSFDEEKFHLRGGDADYDRTRAA